MLYSKIKYSKGKVELAWTDERATRTITHDLSSFDEPLQEFKDALQALADHVIDVCELPDEWVEGLTVIGVSFSENDTQGLGIVVTATKKLTQANAPLVLNTPHMSAEGSAGMSRLSTRTLDLIDTLEAEARRYHVGERAQPDMFSAKPEETTAEPAGVSS
jgi:hypothetical protein